MGGGDGPGKREGKEERKPKKVVFAGEDEKGKNYRQSQWDPVLTLLGGKSPKPDTGLLSLTNSYHLTTLDAISSHDRGKGKYF